MFLVGGLHSDAADAVANLVAPLRQNLVFLLGDRLGVAQGVGPERAMGIAAHHVQINLGPPQVAGLLAEAQHLLWRQFTGQLNPVFLLAGPPTLALLQLFLGDVQQAAEPIPQGGPGPLRKILGLQIEAVDQTTGDQDLAMAIQDPPAHGIPGQQADAVFVGPLTVLTAMQKLQPTKAQHHRRREEEHQPQEDRRLPLETGTAMGIGGDGQGFSSLL